MGKGDPQQAEGQDVLQSLLHADEPGRAREVETSSLFRQFRRVLQEMLREMQNMSAKEKSKFEDMAKSDKARYNSGMKNYVPPKGDEKGKKKDFSAPKRPPSAFFLFCSEHCPKIKSEHPGLSIRDTSEKLREMWSKQSAKDKQPYEQKAAKLKKYGNNTPAYRAKGKREAGKNSPGCPTGSKMNGPEDEEEEKEEEEDEDEEEEDEDQE